MARATHRGRTAGSHAPALANGAQCRNKPVLFLLFHRRLCGPLTASQFHHRPDEQHRPQISKLEAAYYKADRAIEEILAILQAA